MKNINEGVELKALCKTTKAQARQLAQLDTHVKNKVLTSLAKTLWERKQELLDANVMDCEKAVALNVPETLIERLRVSNESIEQIVNAIALIIELPDPLNIKSHQETRPNGLSISKVKIPLGVILMIYESRPNVTVEAAALAFKSGNAIVLRGGKEAFLTNQVIAGCWESALSKNEIDTALVRVLSTKSKSVLKEMLRWDDLIDVVIPRGGAGLIRFVVENSYIPVIKHYKGVCHLYVDEFADLNKAIEILINGKTQRPGVCNAIEGLVIHQKVAAKFLKRAQSEDALSSLELVGCEKTQAILPSIGLATDLDFATEFLALKISIKVVENIDEAIDFIHQFGSGHTEVIISENSERTRQFIRQVDASVLMANASSRFSDGGELGLGAEIGISTSKIHAYGPMGMESLTSEKFVVYGEGQIRE